MKNQFRSIIDSIMYEAERVNGKPMTRTALARTLDVSPGSVSKWANGQSEPSEDSLAKLNGLLTRLKQSSGKKQKQKVSVEQLVAVAGGMADSGNGHANGVDSVNRVAKIMEEMKDSGDEEPEVDEAEADEFNDEPTINVSEHYAIGLPEAPVKPTQEVADSIGAAIKQQIKTLKIKPTSKPTVEFRRDASAPNGVKATCSFFADIDVEALDHILKNHNVHNRDANKKHAHLLANDMRRGHFELTGETIIFDEDLQVADAQHRLFAALSLGKTLHGLVVIGVSRRVARVINSAKIRSVRDRLVCAGRPFAETRANVLRLLNRIDKSLEDLDGLDFVDNASKLVQFHGPVAFDLERHYAQFDLEQAIEFVHGLRWKIGSDLPRHVGAVFYLFAAQESPSVAAHFLRLIADGGAPANSYILASCHKIAALAKKSTTSDKAKRRTSEQIKLLCLGWNGHCSGRQIETGKLQNSHNATSTKLISTIRKPTAAVEAESLAETPDVFVKAVRDRAHALAKREVDNRRARASDVDGFSESIRRSMEAS